jgi:hypothetical protein
MTSKKQVYVSLEEDYAREFHKRCIANKTTMAAVLRNGINSFMKEHPSEKIGGIV